MNMSGMGFGTCASVNSWMITNNREQWTKIPPVNTPDTMRRSISCTVKTSKTPDTYDRGVISSTSPPVMASDGGQCESRLRSLLTKAKRSSRAHTRQGKEILKGLLGQPSTNNTTPESNFLIKGLLNSGVLHQDDHLLNSLGFGNVRSSPTSVSPQAARSPAFSQNTPMCEVSPQSYNSPSPTGSSKRGGDDDIYIERQIIKTKKTCYSPPAFHSLPASSAKSTQKDGTNANTICEKNKMLASLLATHATTPAIIPPLPESVITSTPQERMTRVPGKTRQNSTASWSGGTISYNDPASPPMVPSPKVNEYKQPIAVANRVQQPQESYPVNAQIRTPVPVPIPASVQVPSSPESENCYPNVQPSNQMMDQRNCAVVLNQQRPYACNQEGSWQTYCGQQSQLASTAVQDNSACNSAWQKQLTAQRKLPSQSQEDTVSCSNNYNSATTSQYSSNYYSYDYFNQVQIRQNQDNNNAQQYLMQQQVMMQQQQLTQQSYQQRYSTRQKEYSSIQSQQLQQQQMTGWSSYSGEQSSSMSYSNLQDMKQNDAVRQNFRATNYQGTGNSYQEYWDLQNSDPDPSPRIPNVMGYNQNGGQTNNEQKYLKGDIIDSTVLREVPSKLSGSEDVPSEYHRLNNGGRNELQQMQKNPNFIITNEELPVLGNDNDLSRILDSIIDDEIQDITGQDTRRQQVSNLLPIPVPTNGPTVHPNIFLCNNYGSYDAQSCV